MGMSFEGFDKGGSDKNNNRIYIAIDLKSFYASVECVERGLDPLTTNLVVADESRTEKTICLAVSPSLKAYGISGRARLFEVVQKVKEIKAATGEQVEYIVAKPRMAYYMEYSTKIYNIYLKYIAPEDIHVYSVDEVFIDVTSYLKAYEKTPRELCHDAYQGSFKGNRHYGNGRDWNKSLSLQSCNGYSCKAYQTR